MICTPWISGGSVAGALFQGCVPVFANIDDGYNIDPADVEAKITPRTRAIVAVHMFGNPCDMEAYVDMCKRYGLYPDRGLQPGPLLRVPGQDRRDDGRHHRLQLQRQAHLRRRGRRRTDQQPLALGPGASVRRSGPEPPFRPLSRAALRVPVPGPELQDERSDRGRDARPASEDRRISGEQDTQRQEHHRRPVRRRGDHLTAGAARRLPHWALGFTIDTDRLGCDAYEFAAAVSAESVPMSGRTWVPAGKALSTATPCTPRPGCSAQAGTPSTTAARGRWNTGSSSAHTARELMGRGVGIAMKASFTEEDVGDIIQAIRKVADHYRR